MQTRQTQCPKFRVQAQSSGETGCQAPPLHDLRVDSRGTKAYYSLKIEENSLSLRYQPCLLETGGIRESRGTTTLCEGRGEAENVKE